LKSTTSPLPKTIQVGPIPYKLVRNQRLVDEYSLETHQNAIATVEYATQTIALGDNLGKEQEDETLVHESLHAILRGLGFWEQNNDEHFVQALAYSWTDWIKRNPKLIAFIQEK
jgi:hypothetical protein